MNATQTPFTQQENFDVGALYAGTYLKADDLAGKTYTATIVAVERVEIPETDGSIKPKAAVQLQGWPAKLMLNKTNFETIAGAYGRQSAGWLGKRLEVYPDQTFFGGKSVACVRVRVPRSGAPVAAVLGSAPPATLMASTAASTTPALPVEPQAMLPPLMTTTDFIDDVPY